MLTAETFRTLEQMTKHSAREVFEKIMDNETQSPAAETAYLRFISASAKYLNHVRSAQMVLESPDFGIRRAVDIKGR